MLTQTRDKKEAIPRIFWTVIFLVLGFFIFVAVATGNSSLYLQPEEILKAPLVLGLPTIENDEKGPFICGANDQGPGIETYLAFSIKNAERVLVTPNFELRNPFGDRNGWDCVAVDYSFDGATYTALAALKSYQKEEVKIFNETVSVVCKGKEKLFLRFRISGWWYRMFPRIREVKLEAQPDDASISIDERWDKKSFFQVFSKFKVARERKPAPHILYLTGALSLDFGLLVRQEPVDGYLFFNISEEAIKDNWEMDMVRLYEAAGVQFFIRTSSLEVAEAVLKEAPQYCGGFCVCEVWNGDAFMKNPQFYYSLLELAYRYGKKFVWYEHGRDGSYGLGWWGWCMEHPELFKRIFDPKFKETLIPLHENNDPRSPMPNLGIVLGTWLQRLVKEWGASVQTWYWNDAGYGICETCPPELISRMMLQYLSLGATWFEIEPGSMFVTSDENGLPNRSKQWEGLQRVYELLAKGLFRIPQQSQLLSISPLGFRLNRGVSGLSIFDPHPGQAEVPNTYAPKFLYAVNKFPQETIPVTKYGIIPLFVPYAPIPKGFKAIETDGKFMKLDGRELDIDTIVKQFDWDSRFLPFVSPEGCVLSWEEKDGYGICVLHPDEKEPREATFRIEVRAPVKSLKDLETSEEFKVAGGVVNVPLSPEKTFRILGALR